MNSQEFKDLLTRKGIEAEVRDGGGRWVVLGVHLLAPPAPADCECVYFCDCVRSGLWGWRIPETGATMDSPDPVALLRQAVPLESAIRVLSARVKERDTIQRRERLESNAAEYAAKLALFEG
jgi:hypothetical protein